eukprot:CAMPEP_0201483104 /NCGR_PEP_ID=MMETSP0151_2-20130828/7334_1 /ASSEMBLY_ACC=CAM_ASM_000257 /TAXON_ID=200890 /ORGANISM="Paramoeba atlantica, Strain 621/1 / CCAP 1560/9" /LENGTH=102 /DNA_ID=CAMNT_0047866087 /DNA_START=58 /DNA_END=362 /DNA_ORIENTATION=-
MSDTVTPPLQYRSYTFPSGCTYAGTVLGDTHMHGYGEWTHPSGEGYRGEYEQNKPHGCGTHTAASGEVYLGEWSRGLRQGKGVVTNHEAESNSKSVGSFHAG